MKYYSLIILLFFPLNSYSQTEKIKTYYDNGQIKSKGKIYTYGSFDKRLNEKGKYYYKIRKKNKKWTYWHENGNLERIEHYDLVIDLNQIKI